MALDLNSEGTLDPGIHVATWEDLEAAFGQTRWRRKLLEGLLRAARNLKAAGCSRLYVDGSFVTDKQRPSDFDGCWEPHGVDGRKLDPVLLTFANGRQAQKLKYGGELFPASWQAEATPPWRTFLEFFQNDKNTGNKKGIVAIDLGDLP